MMPSVSLVLGSIQCDKGQNRNIHQSPCRAQSTAQSCPALCNLLQPARLICPWGFSRQEYWSGLPCPPPEDLPNPEIEPRSPTLQADSLPSETPGKRNISPWGCHNQIAQTGWFMKSRNFSSQFGGQGVQDQTIRRGPSTWLQTPYSLTWWKEPFLRALTPFTRGRTQDLITSQRHHFLIPSPWDVRISTYELRWG